MRRLTLASLLLALCALPIRAEILEQILVKVNGEILTKTDLEERQVTYLRQRNQQYTEDQLRNDESLKQILAEITPDLIVDAVDELLMLQRGKELGYRLADDRFKEVIDNIKKENKIETEEQFQAALKQEGMTVEDLRRSLEKQMVIARVQQAEVMGKISVTEDEERTYYTAHAAEFTTAPSVTLREILIESQADTAQGRNVGLEEEAEQEAKVARERVATGEDFARVAADVSDAPSKANGGLVGPLDRSELSQPLQDLLSKLTVGEVSDVMRISRGYQIIKLEAATTPTVASFDVAKPQIADKVYKAKQEAEFQKYRAKLRATAIIEWKSDELKKMYEQRAGAPAAAPATGH